MKRGEIWTVSGGAPYARKPRPAVILQNDRYGGTESVTICVLTSHPSEKPGLRPLVVPSTLNGLSKYSYIEVDKVSTVPRRNLGNFVGRLEDAHLEDLSHAVTVFLGL
ncbi:MAG: type II toxin-antitoxin system PemK/MazF family toxin [Gammaproteobacteria bacterium]|nr:type II toxin-antitoxin system PemK/MazF family toxin [Gammaproteobacteria bacterium]MDE0274039.1 type II toxin-antitoxin system PemK/MazF family toxin [Gammaproteobacteria bacterium]